MATDKLFWKAVFLGLCLPVLHPQIADCFNDNAHDNLSRRAVDPTLPNAAQMDGFLKTILGFEFPQGIKQPISGQATVERLLAEGSVREDYPSQRVFNHFHDPTRTWNVAGLGRVNLSSIVWSQLPVQGAGANRSWKNAREAYFAALTSATESERKGWYAETFLTLGHLIHHVQDAAAPSHTRDDGHLSFSFLGGGPDPDRFHYWAEGAGLNLINQSQPLRFVTSILNQTGANPLAPVPIARIIDKADGDFGVLSPNLNIGLAEYSNANFFSDGTVLSSAYQYPRLSQLQIGPLETAPHGMPRRYLYFRPGFGEQDYRVSTYSTMLPYIGAALPLEFIDIGIDDNVHADYGRKLFPRAVGYSAGLIDYFIRGRLEVEVPADQSSPNLSAGLRVKVRNITGNDETASGMVVGVLEVQQGNARSWLVSPAQLFEITRAFKEMVFQFSGGASLPSDANLTLMVVYQGPLRFFSTGVGEDQAVAVGRAPLQPLDLNPKDPEFPCGDSDPKIVFTATGGLPPYTWSTSKGEITPEGVNNEKATLKSTSGTKGPSETAFVRYGHKLFNKGNDPILSCSIVVAASVHYNCAGEVLGCNDVTPALDDPHGDCAAMPDFILGGVPDCGPAVCGTDSMCGLPACNPQLIPEELCSTLLADTTLGAIFSLGGCGCEEMDGATVALTDTGGILISTTITVTGN